MLFRWLLLFPTFDITVGRLFVNYRLLQARFDNLSSKKAGRLGGIVVSIDWQMVDGSFSLLIQ